VRSNAKKSVFRNALLDACRVNYERLFLHLPSDRAQDYEDQIQQEKFLKGIEFMGQLYKEGLVSQRIIVSIF